MILSLFAYFISFYLIKRFNRCAKQKYSNFPTLIISNEGIIFYSNKIHRIKIYNAQIMKLSSNVYIKFDNIMITIINVKETFKYENFLYFTSLNETRLVFDCHNIYPYFAINISSQMFDISKLKQQALVDFINNGFDVNNSSTMQKYLRIVKEILKINISNGVIRIKPNKYKLKFQVEYKINDKIRRIIVN